MHLCVQTLLPRIVQLWEDSTLVKNHASVCADSVAEDSTAVGGAAGAPGAPQPLLPGLQGAGDLLL